MIHKLFFALILSSSLLFSLSLSQVKEASPKELGCIQGIGMKKLQNIINYQKSNVLKSVDNLLEVKGIGKVILNNVKTDKLKKACLTVKKEKPKSKNIQREKRKITAE
ncbi:MAG: Unknown protein [uncultured Sulfurovum sp.]|uniref:Helix-hairpin-helix domain-containing protein n=1 Tax=uncultured Sulfurovum sp. TaxID=269237 RepID=A0A6S6UDY0_9BACT|nr:MAG: Unknown protein [uncultured Sulfurovum sp.]